MRLLLTTTALAAALATAGCERRGAEPAPAAPETAEAPAPAATLPAGTAFTYANDETPEGFAQRVAMSDMFEVRASRLALELTQAPAVREFAQMMVDVHTKSGEDLKATLKAQNLAPAMPTTLDPDHQRRLNDLTAASAADFDRVYLDQQTTAHQSALDEIEDYAEGGGNAALKTWAATTAPVVRKHLERARTLDREGADRTETPGGEALPK